MAAVPKPTRPLSAPPGARRSGPLALSSSGAVTPSPGGTSIGGMKLRPWHQDLLSTNGGPIPEEERLQLMPFKDEIRSKRWDFAGAASAAHQTLYVIQTDCSQQLVTAISLPQGMTVKLRDSAVGGTGSGLRDAAVEDSTTPRSARGRPTGTAGDAGPIGILRSPRGSGSPSKLNAASSGVHTSAVAPTRFTVVRKVRHAVASEEEAERSGSPDAAETANPILTLSLLSQSSQLHPVRLGNAPRIASMSPQHHTAADAEPLAPTAVGAAIPSARPNVAPLDLHKLEHASGAGQHTVHTAQHHISQPVVAGKASQVLEATRSAHRPAFAEPRAGLRLPSSAPPNAELLDLTAGTLAEAPMSPSPSPGRGASKTSGNTDTPPPRVLHSPTGGRRKQSTAAVQRPASASAAGQHSSLRKGAKPRGNRVVMSFELAMPVHELILSATTGASVPHEPLPRPRTGVYAKLERKLNQHVNNAAAAVDRRLLHFGTGIETARSSAISSVVETSRSRGDRSSTGASIAQGSSRKQSSITESRKTLHAGASFLGHIDTSGSHLGASSSPRPSVRSDLAGDHETSAYDGLSPQHGGNVVGGVSPSRSHSRAFEHSSDVVATRLDEQGGIVAGNNRAASPSGLAVRIYSPKFSERTSPSHRALSSSPRVANHGMVPDNAAEAASTPPPRAFLPLKRLVQAGEGIRVRRLSIALDPALVMQRLSEREKGRGPSRHDVLSPRSGPPSHHQQQQQHMYATTVVPNEVPSPQASWHGYQGRRFSLEAQAPPSVDGRDESTRREEQRAASPTRRSHTLLAGSETTAPGTGFGLSMSPPGVPVGGSTATATRGIYRSGALVEGGLEMADVEMPGRGPASSHIGYPRPPSHPVGIFRTPMFSPVTRHRKVPMNAVLEANNAVVGGTPQPTGSTGAADEATSRSRVGEGSSEFYHSSDRPMIASLHTMPASWGMPTEYLKQTLAHASRTVTRRPASSATDSGARGSSPRCVTFGVGIVQEEADDIVHAFNGTTVSSAHRAVAMGVLPDDHGTGTNVVRAQIPAMPRFNYPSILGWSTSSNAATTGAAPARPHTASSSLSASDNSAPSRHSYVLNVATPADYRLAAIYSNTGTELMATLEKQAQAASAADKQARRGSLGVPSGSGVGTATGDGPASGNGATLPLPVTPSRPGNVARGYGASTVGGAFRAPSRPQTAASFTQATAAQFLEGGGPVPSARPQSAARTFRSQQPLDGAVLMQSLLRPSTAGGGNARSISRARALAELSQLGAETQQSLIRRESTALESVSKDYHISWRKPGWGYSTTNASSTFGDSDDEYEDEDAEVN